MQSLHIYIQRRCLQYSRRTDSPHFFLSISSLLLCCFLPRNREPRMRKERGDDGASLAIKRDVPVSVISQPRLSTFNARVRSFSVYCIPPGETSLTLHSLVDVLEVLQQRAISPTQHIQQNEVTPNRRRQKAKTLPFSLLREESPLRTLDLDEHRSNLSLALRL